MQKNKTEEQVDIKKLLSEQRRQEQEAQKEAEISNPTGIGTKTKVETEQEENQSVCETAASYFSASLPDPSDHKPYQMENKQCQRVDIAENKVFEKSKKNEFNMNEFVSYRFYLWHVHHRDG